MSTSERLLAAAEQILVERGVIGLSVRKVGDQAGVNPTLVTYHFKTIENLLAELARRNIAPIFAEWDLIQPGMTLDEVLSKWLLPMGGETHFTPGGRALVVLDELAAHAEGAPRKLLLEALADFIVRLRESLHPHFPHLDAGELRARIRFISAGALGPSPRTHGAPVLPDGRALDDPKFLLAFARAALAGPAADW